MDFHVHPDETSWKIVGELVWMVVVREPDDRV
jgi:hypothetical protein